MDQQEVDTCYAAQSAEHRQQLLVRLSAMMLMQVQNKGSNLGLCPPSLTAEHLQVVTALMYKAVADRLLCLQ